MVRAHFPHSGSVFPLHNIMMLGDDKMSAKRARNEKQKQELLRFFGKPCRFIIWPFYLNEHVYNELSRSLSRNSICSPHLIEFIAKWISSSNVNTVEGKARRRCVGVHGYRFFSSLHHLRHTQTSSESAVCPIFFLFSLLKHTFSSTKCYFFTPERLIFSYAELRFMILCNVGGGNLKGEQFEVRSFKCDAVRLNCASKFSLVKHWWKGNRQVRRDYQSSFIGKQQSTRQLKLVQLAFSSPEIRFFVESKTKRNRNWKINNIFARSKSSSIGFLLALGFLSMVDGEESWRRFSKVFSWWCLDWVKSWQRFTINIMDGLTSLLLRRFWRLQLLLKFKKILPIYFR